PAAAGIGVRARERRALAAVADRRDAVGPGRVQAGEAVALPDRDEEAGRVHAQRFEDPPAQEVAQAFAADALDDEAGDVQAIAIDPVRAWLERKRQPAKAFGEAGQAIDLRVV